MIWVIYRRLKNCGTRIIDSKHNTFEEARKKLSVRKKIEKNTSDVFYIELYPSDNKLFNSVKMILITKRKAGRVEIIDSLVQMGYEDCDKFRSLVYCSLIDWVKQKKIIRRGRNTYMLPDDEY